MNCQCPKCGAEFTAELQIKLADQTIEKLKRKGGWPKGKPRKPKTPESSAPAPGPIVGTAAPPVAEPPVHTPKTLVKRDPIAAKTGTAGYAQAVRLWQARSPWPLPNGAMISHRGPEAGDFVQS